MRDKLGVKALKTVLLGYDSLTKGYYCFEPISNKIIVLRDVRFDEQQKGNFKRVNSPIIDHNLFVDLFPSIPLDEIGSDLPGPLVEPHSNSRETNHERHLASPSLERPSSSTLLDMSHSPTHSPSLVEVLPFVPRISTRMQGAPLKYTKDHHAYLSEMQYTSINSIFALIMIDGMTRSISLLEALCDPQWAEAIQKELDALIKNRT